MGFPIRRSLDQSSFAAPQGLSQRTTSFIASQRQGIHRMLLRHLITLMIDVRRLPSRSPSGGLTLIRKTIAARSFDRALACRTHPVKDAVTSSLVAEPHETRLPGMFPLHDFKHPLAALRLRANCS